MGIVAAEVVILGGSAAVFVSSRGAGGTAAVDFDLCRPAGSAAADAADDAGVATAAVGSSADVEATVTAGAAVGEAGSDARAGLFAAIADDAPHVISAAITLAIWRRSKSYSAQ
jgi:hypothetical protein